MSPNRNSSPEVDDYIAQSAAFAQPILKKIRAAFHKAHPDVEETIKWGFPHFEYRGLLGSMAAFRNHVTWSFWKAKLMDDPDRILKPIGETSMGGSKVSDLSELPPQDVLVAYVREAIRLNEEGVKTQRRRPAAKAELEIPADLTAALKRSPAARKAFESFPPSHKREYVEWITEAKQEATRQKRLATTIEWLSEGKPRNWKYIKK